MPPKVLSTVNRLPMSAFLLPMSAFLLLVVANLAAFSEFVDKKGGEIESFYRALSEKKSFFR
jgi:hypothetical protein